MSLGQRYVPISVLPHGFSGRQLADHMRTAGPARDALESRCRDYTVDGAHYAAWCATTDAEEHLEMARKSTDARARTTHVRAGLRSVERMDQYLDESQVMRRRYDVDSAYDPLNLVSRCHHIARALRGLVTPRSLRTPVVLTAIPLPPFRLEFRA